MLSKIRANIKSCLISILLVLIGFSINSYLSSNLKDNLESNLCQELSFSEKCYMNYEKERFMFKNKKEFLNLFLKSYKGNDITDIVPLKK